MAEQSQATEKAEVIGRAIYNPPQKYPHNVKVGTRTFVLVDNEGNSLGGKNNPCPIEVIYKGRVYSLAVGDIRLFPDEVADFLLERYPFLVEKVELKVKVKAAPADWREPTKEEAPLYHRLKREAARGHRIWALTPEGERVLLEAGVGAVGAPQPMPSKTPVKSREGIESIVEDDTAEI